MNYLILLPAVAIVNLLCGIAFGVITERLKWNNLIQKGVIPKPQKDT